MDFDDSPEEAAFRAEARAFLEAYADRLPVDGESSRPLWSRNHSVADPDEARAFYARCRKWQRTLYDHGWAGISWPKEFGGRGGLAAHEIIFADESRNFDVTTSWLGAGMNLAGPTIIIHGTDDQRQRYLDPMLRADETWCQLFSEPGAGSDLAALQTSAVRDGDEWVINGQKVWTSGAHEADFGLLIARSDPDVPKHRGISYFVCDMSDPGVDVRPLVQANGAQHFSEVFLSDVRISAERVLGSPNEGWRIAKTTLKVESAMIGGLPAAAGFRELVRSAEQWGRTDDPIVRQAIATAYTYQEVLRFTNMRLESAIRQGRTGGPSGRLMKNMFTRMLGHNADAGLQIEGARAGLWEEGVDGHRWQSAVIDQFTARIGGGTEEVQRNNIGERELGLPAETRGDVDVPFNELRK